MKKVLFLVPHLSTGGMPQYTYDLMRKIINDVEVYCVEYSCISPTFVVQRNRVIQLLGEKFFSLGDDKTELLNLVQIINPDVIHLQEVPEYFLSNELATEIYDKNRNYVIVETSHDSSFPSSNKRFFPDHFALISQYQKNEFSKLNIPIDFVEADIEYKQRQDRTDGLLKLGLDPNIKHVVNVGLFTPRKNQVEAIEYARMLENYPVQFHFVGNQADNFRPYWEPILQNLPSNVKIWGERDDVDNFYSCMDLMLFTSRGTGNDKETSPLVIREAIGYNLPSLIFNLPVYLNSYDKYETVKYMDFDDKNRNLELIKETLDLKNEVVTRNVDLFSFQFKSEENKIEINYNGDRDVDCKVTVKDADSNVPIYWFESNFAKNSGYWVIPSPKHIYDFSKDDTFRSFLIEFYDLSGNLLFSKELPIKNSSVKRTVKLNVSNPFDCFLFNYNEMFVDGRYDCYGIENVENVFDIGANNGLFSLYLLNRGCKNVYAFEPNKEATKNLKSILQEKYKDEYKLIEKAVGINDNDLKFYISPNNTTIGSISKEHVSNHSNPIEINVPSISLKSFISENNIDKIGLIKMDIEGGEYEIIRNLDDDIFSITESFLIEFHNNDGKIVDELIERITSFGFIVDQIREESSKNNTDITESYNQFKFGTIYFKRDGKKVQPLLNEEVEYQDKSIMVKKKVKAVHLLLKEELDSPRQIQSIENVSQIEKLGITYIQHMNSKYIDLPPVSKSRRPSDVSMERSPSALNPTHYGCYESMKNAILAEFDSDDDFLILFEGDAKIYNHRDFIRNLNSVLPLMEPNKIGYLSMGGKFNIQDGSVFSSKIEDLNESFFICDRIVGCHCIIFPKWFREKLKTLIREEPWDAADLYFNDVFNRHNIKMAVSNDVYVTQFDGVSMIEGIYKNFSK